MAIASTPSARPTPDRTVTGDSILNSDEDTYIEMFGPDGTPVPTFGANGVLMVDRSGNMTGDRGVDVAFRPNGGLAVLEKVGDSSAQAVIQAYTDTGAPDT